MKQYQVTLAGMIRRPSSPQPVHGAVVCDWCEHMSATIDAILPDGWAQVGDPFEARKICPECYATEIPHDA